MAFFSEHWYEKVGEEKCESVRGEIFCFTKQT